MPEDSNLCEEKRAEFVRLLEGDEEEEWRITKTALEEGRKLLPMYKGHMGAYSINAFVLDLLQSDASVHEVTLGSGETACVFNTHLSDNHPLYIKLKLEDEIAVIMSFHISKHS